jgi:DNA-directed RNA polymerase specialized sigma24 family protein
LPFPVLAKWLLQYAHSNAAETILDHIEQRLVGVDVDLLAIAADEPDDSSERPSLFEIITRQERRFMQLREKGLPETQIAQRMKITQSAIRKIKSRLRQKLRKSPFYRSFWLP